jgi:L-2,4-diaminobutyrate decarboxylase
MILNKNNKKESERILQAALTMGIEFKIREDVQAKPLTVNDIDIILGSLPDQGRDMDALLEEFQETILPFCTNFSSSNFQGFPDAGNAVAGMTGALLADCLQQNLINQSFCAPSATYVEIAVLQWLRETVGFSNNEKLENIWGVGGIITPGGTVSNAAAMMLARENKQAYTIEKGVTDPESFKIIVPRGIGHYSVKSAQMWLGCGNNLIEVDTVGFRYDLEKLREALTVHKGKVMALVAYAGDSRTMTVDNFCEIEKIAREIDPSIWLHADACHGFSLGFSSELRHKLNGIEKFDSISTDPHKVMLVPYTVSALLVREPENLKKITSLSDLIMQEGFAFGQITPFLGSKSWMSLKLWFVMKNLGKVGLDALITQRHHMAVRLMKKLKKDPDFTVLNIVDINAVVFMYTGSQKTSVETVNTLNKNIHDRMLHEGKFHLHQFSIPDDGVFEKGTVLFPLRFMSGNPNISDDNLDAMIKYVRSLGQEEYLKI